MTRKQWVFCAVWFLAYNLTLEFFRFRFGFFEISGVYLILYMTGIGLMSRH
jgi:hypothetical protein